MASRNKSESNGHFNPAMTSTDKSNDQIDDIEPESIIQWKAEFRARLEVRDKTEAVQIEDMEETARQELSSWGIQYRETLVRARKANRVHDEDLRAANEKAAAASAAVAATNATHTEFWDRVCQLCDFTNPPNGTPVVVTAAVGAPGGDGSGGKTPAAGKDIHRMRSLLLQLKQNAMAVNR